MSKLMLRMRKKTNMRILSLRVKRDMCFKVKELERPKTTVTRNLTLLVHLKLLCALLSLFSKGFSCQILNQKTTVYVYLQ
jgi:hypothetical protein